MGWRRLFAQLAVSGCGRLVIGVTGHLSSALPHDPALTAKRRFAYNRGGMEPNEEEEVVETREERIRRMLVENASGRAYSDAIVIAGIVVAILGVIGVSFLLAFRR